MVPDEDDFPPEEVDFDAKWHGTSFGTYLPPKYDWAKNGGGVDIIFHFHGGQLAEKEWRMSRLKAVVVSVALGIGSSVYEQAFQDPRRFARMIVEVVQSMQAETGEKLRLRRLGIVSFSAGFGAVRKILTLPTYFDKIDTLILLDSLHTGYTPEKKADLRGLDTYIRYAAEARQRKRLMILTHSAISTYDYASSTESAGALLEANGSTKIDLTEKNARGMVQLYRVDEGSFHAFGFKGETAKDHMEHLAMAGDFAKTFVARRWSRLEALERSAGQPPPPVAQ